MKKNITATMKADYTLFVGGGQHYRRTEIIICDIHHKLRSVGWSRILLLFLLRLVVIVAVVALNQIDYNGKYNNNSA